MIWSFEDFELDDELFELRLGGERVAIRPQALDVLLHLVRNRERVVTREELVREVWKGAKVTDTAIPQAIFAARRALGEEGDEQRLLETIRGRGYRFIAKVHETKRASKADLDVHDVPDTAPAGVLPFVGRAGLVEGFGALLGEAMRGRGGIMLVSGAVGSGKTRATIELSKLAEARGATVLFGRAYADDGVPELWPWLQVIRAAEPHEPSLAAVLDGSKGGEKFNVFDDVARGLVALARRRGAKGGGLVVMLDDVHYADAGSLLLMKLVAQAFRDVPALVVATYRDAATATNPVLARTVGGLARDEPTRCARLEPLDEASVGALAKAAIGRTIPPETVARLSEKTSGTPLFLAQILHAMRMETKLSALPEGATSALLSLDSMREAVALHLGELSAECREVLSVASVLGPRFSPAVVGKMMDRPADGVLAALDEAITARVIALGEKEARFLHVLVRDVLYKKLNAAQRARLHESAARVLAERGAIDEARVHEERARSLLG